MSERSDDGAASIEWPEDEESNFSDDPMNDDRDARQGRPSSDDEGRACEFWPAARGGAAAERRAGSDDEESARRRAEEAEQDAMVRDAEGGRRDEEEEGPDGRGEYAMSENDEGAPVRRAQAGGRAQAGVRARAGAESPASVDSLADEDDEPWRVPGANPEDDASDAGGGVEIMQTGNSYFQGFGEMKKDLLNPYIRRAELLGLQGGSSSAWTDVRMTSLCGSLEHDTNFHGHGSWRSDPVPRGEHRTPMPEAVLRARKGSWFDTRPRKIDGSLVDPVQHTFEERHARAVKGCTPARAWCLNFDADLLTQNAPTMVSCKFAQPKHENPAAMRTALRSLATAQVASTLCQGVEMGQFSGQHAEHDATREAVPGDGAAEDGEGRKRRKRGDGLPSVHVYEFMRAGDVHQRSSMFRYLIEYVRDRRSAHVMHGVRFWKLVIHPPHSDTQLCAGVFDMARQVTNCDELNCDAPRRENKEKYDRTRSAAPNPKHQGAHAPPDPRCARCAPTAPAFACEQARSPTTPSTARRRGGTSRAPRSSATPSTSSPDRAGPAPAGCRPACCRRASTPRPRRPAPPAAGRCPSTRPTRAPTSP